MAAKHRKWDRPSQSVGNAPAMLLPELTEQGFVSFGSPLSQVSLFSGDPKNSKVENWFSVHFSTPSLGKVSQRDRLEVTARYQAENPQQIGITMGCNCLQLPHPHAPHTYEKEHFSRGTKPAKRNV